MTRAIQSVELPGGRRLQYVEQGDRSGVPMVLLHGYSHSWRSFELVLPHLPPDVRAFAVTLRGHGDAARPADGYRPRDFAADIARFVELLGIGAAVIAGHSMGSTIAQRFALDHPERTLGLALLGSLGAWHRNPSVLELWGAVAALEDPVDPVFVREFQASTVRRPVPPGVLDSAVRESLKVPARVWRAIFEGFLRDDFAAELGAIGAPALIIWGDTDPFGPRAAQEELMRAIARSQLVVYRGAGHAMHWEQPARVAADLARFARSLSHPARTAVAAAARAEPAIA
jgi:non-heme chloroperoxidase